MDEEPNEGPVIAAGDAYELRAEEGGAVLLLRHKAEKLCARLEGEDAERIRTDYDVVKTQYPGWPADQLLAQLWDQGGYSWLAVEEG